ncbi:MAG: hypothetical protein IID42_06955 [Planctomycetes bacterium]|nr:hypothetical protein [Planctomycetota bacterium]
MLLRQSMKLKGIRSVQVLRVWVHCIPLPTAAALLSSMAAIQACDLLGYESDKVVGFSIIIGISLYTCFLLRQGYKRYLRMPHAWGVAVASHLIGLLGLVIVALQIAFGGIL